MSYRSFVDTLARWPENVSISMVFAASALVAAAMVGVVLPLVGLGQMRLVAAGVVAIIGAGMLLVRPGIATALFLCAGLFKADPTISAVVPFDLTFALAGLLVLACAIKLLRSGHLPALPQAYVLYLPLLLMTLASLLYTPDLGDGASKAVKFILLTGLGVVCPFFLFDSARQVRVFLYTMAVLGLILSSQSLSGLGGENRLTMPGRLTIQLGTAAGTTIAVALATALPGLPFRRRILLYPVVGLAFVALLGSGARGPMIGAVLCVLFALVYFRQLWLDAALLGAAGILGLAQIGIPMASFNYLGTLLSDDPSSAMATRTGLLELAWHLFREHPLLGVGIGGFAYYSRDPENTFPHNIFLEIGAELGFIALIAFTALVVWVFWEAYKQLRERDFPFRLEAAGVFSLLIFGFIQMIKSGDVNDNRTMWLLMGLPFLLRFLANREILRKQENVAVATPVTSEAA
ncbi:MAG TPA: O-antigen ligase family protein [Terriglobales bacterium]|nr:O-antigen ligase family protein [Terriglobales bacterium]